MFETTRWVQHTRDVLDASSTLMTSVLDAESASRGYIVTHDSTFLAPYQGAPERARSALVSLRRLTVDNAPQQRRIDTLDTVLNRRLTLIDSTIDLERRGLTQIIRGTAAPRPGRDLMASLRRLTDSVEASEERLLADRRVSEKRAIELAAVVILLGTLAAGTLAFTVNRNFDLALIERRTALDDVRQANDRLQESAIELEHQAEAAQNAALEAEQATEHAREALVAAEESERRAERLQEATEAFSGASELGDVANLIVDQAMTAVRGTAGALAAVDRERNALRFVAVRHIDALSVGSDISLDEQRPMCMAVREAQPIIANTNAAFPLHAEGKVIGVLLVRFHAPRALDPADRALMSAMSRIAAEALERARLYDAERNARAEAEAANRAKAAFLASMSHELRTPLQAALGFAQLVRSGVYGAVNDQQAEVLGRVERSQTHLSRLIDDILDFARLEAGRVRIEPVPVALKDVIADLTPLVEPQAVKKQIELSLDAPPDSLRVMADRQRLQQILVNLVGNAIKFTPERGVIRVGALGNGEMATIAIRDNGVGIPADRLQAIFEPFVQVEDSFTRTASGAGLGLAISRDLARAMGGDLKVESELGRGSTFSVVLPLAV